ncbi:MAG: tetratricopeptide repeat protein [Ardenticatenaceae bacterium]|nr:tetratricopeptide repeat protein [Ardenticatenaceae bacterium]
MKIKFWGARGSVPSPITPDVIEEKICQAIWGMPEIDTSDMDAVRAYVGGLPVLQRRTAGGNTACVEIQAGNETIIVDAGSGIRDLGFQLMKGPCGRGEGVLHLLFTHCHWDHIQGFPFFVPAFIPGNQIFVYSIHDVESALVGQQEPPFFPVPLSYLRAEMSFTRLEVGRPFAIGKVTINTLENAHPGKAYSYRFETQHNVYVHASDAEYKKLDDAHVQPYIEFFRDADVLVFDTQYTLREAWQKVDWGHSSAMIGADLARRAGVKKMLMFHHDPTYSDDELQKMLMTAQDYQLQDATLPRVEIEVAYEGMVLDLIPPGAVDVHVDGDVMILTPLNGRDGFELLADQLAQVDKEGKSVIDLSQVETLTTASLQEIVALSQARQEGPVVLAAPSAAIQQVIKLAGYLDYFPIYTSVEAALTAVQAREALNLPGQLLGKRYQIQNKENEDPLSAVLRATDTWTEETVAIKIINPAFSQETIERVMQQSAQLIDLNFPYIVPVYAWEKEKDFAFIVESYIMAPSLQDMLDRKEEVDPDEALEIALDLTQTLEYVHSRGIIHGDLRPHHIYMTDAGIKLGGFGLGRLLEGRNLLEAPMLFLPTPYLAPEQILGQSLDARTDLYALGVVLYRLFAGRLPFVGNDMEIMRAHIYEETLPLRQLNPSISPSMEHLILKLLSKNPNGRYTSAHQTHRVSSNLTISVDDPTFSHRAPFIKRERQLKTLQTCWQSAQSGEGYLVFVTGEPGVGKTTLVQQVVAQSEPPVLLIGRCREAEGKTAYHLFSEILQMYFATVPPEFYDKEAQKLLSNFVRLVPEIRHMLPDVAALPSLEPAEEQLRLMSGLTQFVRKATQERPWFLILENLQWADSSSLELLRYLSHHLPTMRLLIVGIYRDVELEQGHPLMQMIRDLGSYPTFKEISLGRLDAAGVAQILEFIWQQEVPQALVEKVYQHTEGNPFYVEEVANGLMDDGLVVWQNGRWQFPTLAELRLPATVHEAVWRRISRLNPVTQNLLGEAAVFGQTFRFEDLQAISGLSEWEVLEHLDVAMERQLVQEVPGETMLRFRHAEIQQVLYADLGVLRRRLLHRTVAEWYEKKYITSQPSPETAAPNPVAYPLLAYHFHHAEDVNQERHYARLAGVQAAAQFANAEAITYFSRVLALTPEADLLLQYEVHLLRERIYDRQGIRQAQVQDLAVLTDLAERLADGEAASMQRKAVVALRQSNFAEGTGDYAGAIVAAQTAVALAQHCQDVSLEAIGYLRHGSALSRLGNYDEARPQFEKALKLAETADLKQIKARSLRNLGIVTWQQGDYEACKAYDQQALALYQAIGDLHGEGKASGNLGVSYWDMGDYVQAVYYYKRALEIYRQIGDRHGEAIILNNLGVVADEQGDYETAVAHIEKALTICRDIGDRHGEAARLSSLSRPYHHLGDDDTALKYSQEAVTLAQEWGGGRQLGYALNNMGNALYGLQRWAEAAAAYQQSVSIRQELGEIHLAMDAHAGLARVYLTQANLAEALTQVEIILAYLQKGRLDGTSEPSRISWTCYQVLQAANDPRATGILQMAVQRLQALAVQIGDDAVRRSFLENVAVNRLLVAEWAKQREQAE